MALELNNVDIYQALDIVSPQTGSFWQAVNKNTIVISNDNQNKRREYEEQILKTIYLSNSTSNLELTETISVLRALFNLRFVAPVTALNAIVIRDTPDQVAAAVNDVPGVCVASRSTLTMFYKTPAIPEVHVKNC